MLGSQDEGEDALQQTFLRAHRSLLAQGAPDELRPWLFAIARNRCLTMLASRKAAAVPVDEVEQTTDGPGADAEGRADLRDLLADIARLPADQRSALVLAELGDLSHTEIARVIEVPTAKVKALVHQARTRLIADRDARETPCHDVRELLATARGGELRRGPLRRHLALCDSCRAYKQAVTEQRAALALVLPVLPSAGLKETIFGALGGGGGGSAAAASGAALTSGGASAGVIGNGLGAKLAIGVVLAGGAGGGAVVVDQVRTSPARPAAAAAERPPAATGDRTTTTRAATTRSGASTVLPGERASETGKERREAAAERRRQRAEERRAEKRRRTEAREQAAQDRAADKQARVIARQERKQDRADAKVRRAESKDQRTQARLERLAARPERGSSGTERSATAAPRNSGTRTEQQPVRVKPIRTPTTAPTPSLTPITDGKSGRAKRRQVEEFAP
jgi:RNA polymerase sigma factor (sigma-70 family)